MRHPLFPVVAGSLLLAALAGCSPVALQAALDAAKAADAKGAASPGPAAGTPPAGTTTPASGDGTTPAAGTTTPAAGTSTGAAAGLGEADMAAAKAFMAAVDAAAAQEPEKVARLFVTGLVAYAKNQALGKGMMGYACRIRDAQATASSPTGYEPLDAGGIYFRTVDRNTKLGSYYLDSPASAELPWDQMAAKVVIDKEYKAVDQGLSEDGKMWTFYIKVTGAPTEVRPRPLRLQMDGERGWRVSNFSSLVVQP